MSTEPLSPDSLIHERTAIIEDTLAATPVSEAVPVSGEHDHDPLDCAACKDMVLDFAYGPDKKGRAHAARQPEATPPADLAGLLHAVVIDTGWGSCVHSPENEWRPFCEETAARLQVAGVGLSAHHAITPECGPICWTTGHHHDVEACDGCRRLADMMHAAGAALRSEDAAPQPDAGLRDLIEAADTGGEVIHLAVTPTLTAALDASRPDAAAPPMVLLDVDGVVLDARGDPMPGIGFALDLLACLGFEVVLWSAGGPAYAEAAGQRTGHHGAISGYRGKPTYPPTEEEALRFVRRRPVLQVDDDPTERVADWQFMVPALRSTPAAPQPERPSVTWRPADRTVLAVMAPIVDGLCSGCGTKPSRETGSCRCLFRIDDVIRGKA